MATSYTTEGAFYSETETYVWSKVKSIHYSRYADSTFRHEFTRDILVHKGKYYFNGEFMSDWVQYEPITESSVNEIFQEELRPFLGLVIY